MEGSGGAEGTEEEDSDSEGHDHVARFGYIERAVLVDVPGPVDGAADSPEDRAGRPEEAAQADDTQGGPRILLTAVRLASKAPALPGWYSAKKASSWS